MKLMVSKLNTAGVSNDLWKHTFVWFKMNLVIKIYAEHFLLVGRKWLKKLVCCITNAIVNVRFGKAYINKTNINQLNQTLSVGKSIIKSCHPCRFRPWQMILFTWSTISHLQPPSILMSIIEASADAQLRSTPTDDVR